MYCTLLGCPRRSNVGTPRTHKLLVVFFLQYGEGQCRLENVFVTCYCRKFYFSVRISKTVLPFLGKKKAIATTSTRSEKVEAPPAKRHLEGEMYIRLAIYYNVYILHAVLSLYIQA